MTHQLAMAQHGSNRNQRSADSLIRVLLSCRPGLVEKAARAPGIFADQRSWEIALQRIYGCLPFGRPESVWAAS